MIERDPDTQNVTAPAENQDTKSSPHNIPITGRFDQYRSSFWAAALAIIGIRYAPRPFLKLGGWWDSKKNKDNFYRKHVYSALAGGVMESVTGFFAYRTWQDMRSVCSQALAWEFNKDPKDVTFSDFRNSQNTVVQQTVANYMHRNLLRSGVNLAFFLPYIAGTLFKGLGILKKGRWAVNKWSAEMGADLGIGANAAYLFHDVIVRKGTPFEALQSTIDLKINHTNSIADKITSTDLLDIYERHAVSGTIPSFLGQRGTPAWEKSMALFSRMADLMNQTYKNTPQAEYADFGIDDFIYMVGNKLIDPVNIERSRAYVEIANRYDMPALKEVVKAAQNGGSLAEALQKYPVTLADERVVEPTPVKGKFTDANPPRPLSLTQQVIAGRQKTDLESHFGTPA